MNENVIISHKCEYCGAPNASYVVNPLDEEIYGIQVKKWMCDKCYEDALGDI